MIFPPRRTRRRLTHCSKKFRRWRLMCCRTIIPALILLLYSCKSPRCAKPSPQAPNGAAVRSYPAGIIARRGLPTCAPRQRQSRNLVQPDYEADISGACRGCQSTHGQRYFASGRTAKKFLAHTVFVISCGSVSFCGLSSFLMLA